MKAFVSQAVAVIRQRRPEFKPVLGLILGSGFAEVARHLQASDTIPYAELPGFLLPHVAGHHGELVIGLLAGVPVVCLSGRMHQYESDDHSALAVPILTLQQLGCQSLLITNAAGSLRAELAPQSLVLITDHLNMQCVNPLVGLGDGNARFVNMVDAYDRQHRELLLAKAAQLSLTLHQGVYCAMLGPSFETPAEVNALRQWGADLVGMSTVPEVIVARYCGLRIAALSVVSNMAAGLSAEPLSHAQAMAVTQAALPDLLKLLTAFAQGDR